MWKRCYYSSSILSFSRAKKTLHYDVVGCTNCGFCYASDIPDRALLNQFYQAAEHHLHTDLPQGLARIHADFFNFVTTTVSLMSDSHILGIGAGMGHYLNHFQQAGFTNLQGIEPSPATAELVRKTYGLDVQGANIDGFGAKEPFDLISLCGVLEHISDLRCSMEKIAALVRNDGHLFIAVPDASIFGQAVPAESFLEFTLEYINFFSAPSLDNLLKAYGFEKISVITQHNDFYGNSYLLALYKRRAKQCTSIIRDADASLRVYVELSQQGLQSVEALAADLVRRQEPLLIWGAGALTSRLLCDTSLAKANICCVIDRNKALQGQRLLNTVIADPASIECHRWATVFIAITTYALAIRDTLLHQYAWTGRILMLELGGAS